MSNTTPVTHTVPAGTMQSALQAAGYKAFDYDLIDTLGKIHSTPLRKALLGSVAFACDSFINGMIQSAFSKLRVEMEHAGTARWDTYQAFLAWASGMAASDSLMAEAGMSVKDMRESVQKLYNCRTQCWDLLEHGEMPNPAKPFMRSSITEWLRNPRARNPSADESAKIMQAIRDDATDDDGVLDLDLQREMIEANELKAEAEKFDALKWDKRRGELAATLFDALKIRDDVMDAGFADENAEPFLELDAMYQFKLLSAVPRYVANAMRRLAKDRKVTIPEHAKASIEGKALRKATTLASEHPKFKQVAEELAERG